MKEVYDIILLGLFILVICSFMLFCQKRSENILNERNAKMFATNFASPDPATSDIECEDIKSDDMDNDNNDDIDLIEKNQNKNKNKKIKLSLKSNKKQFITKKSSKKSKKKQKLLTKKRKNNPANKIDDDDTFTDSTDDGMSMAKMREEYYKSQTLTKKFMDLVDDIRDILKSKQLQIQNVLIKKDKPVIVPMAMKIPNNNSNKIQIKVKKHANNNDADSDDNKLSDCDEKVREDESN